MYLFRVVRTLTKRGTARERDLRTPRYVLRSFSCFDFVCSSHENLFEILFCLSSVREDSFLSLAYLAKESKI